MNRAAWIQGEAVNKVDFKKELKHLYSASAKQPVLVDVPTLSYLRIDGRGDPNTSSVYRQAVESLFSLAYTIKFAVKKSPVAIDYGVLPLEGLWWMASKPKDCGSPVSITRST